MLETRTQYQLVLLDEESDGRVKVVQKNSEEFFMTIQQAVIACRQLDKFLDFKEQMGNLWEFLMEWVSERRTSIKSAYLTPRDHDVLFLVVQKDVPFDQELADDLSDLDISAANDRRFGLINLEVMSIPSVSKDSITAFISSE